MVENEIVEHTRNENDKNEDNSKIDCDKGSKKKILSMNHFIEKKII